ncbi:hypothetical protein [Xanthomonas phaseoli]|uniref:R body protein n=1 Tax=Xanthomonas manihotis TaxID=43353 RepID=A0A8I1XL15_XANMN|nr:hypothetical protein [Xanthomonas phaseoli]RWU15685.1 hypothetical protein XANMN_16300 [Xanthomonas phaseoli pv. manihotis str. CIO151]MBO9719871.1 hypothetical protein [Xanthomonas phaseoli pv. manihotis]MBO9758972.1 hypothetical protein [Xanthomonas phaseoli pv. manihotis]MBO9786000.1 hypothetical protein [Xanthomonas phaseoli pv. manihotis]MCC8532936.1 hypothetical protein [Xanthomonas phaseoli]
MEIEITVNGIPSTSDPILSSTALSGLAISQQGALISTLAYANQVASSDLSTKTQIVHQDASNRLRQSILAKAVNGVQALGPINARSTGSLLTSNGMAQSLLDLRATLKSMRTPVKPVVSA